ncbi:MAG TPA: F0F1 ATP synthase subunit B [Stellaceae bacterium]|nr:F0F1 ATP synthase subunit B [Stellaceae bacterium]
MSLHELIADPEFGVLIAFVIGVGYLAYKGTPMITAALDQRAAKIKADLDEAQRLREEAQKTLADFQKKQRDALKEADEIIARARTEAERAAERGERDLEASLERRRRMALEKIALEEAKAVAEVREVAVEIAMAAVRRALAQDLDPARRAKLLDDAIQSLPQALH